MTEYILELLESQAWWVWASAAISAASAFVAATPTPAEGSRWSKVYKVIEVIALNVFRAKD
tara:strand:+ start:326 stop:508 length:183 start_codon:yes stop_codon:yes gene_type:complete